MYHATYENEAMRRAVQKFGRTRGRLDLEAALVHIRNLVDFFWAPSTSRCVHVDGVYAAHFVPDLAAWKQIRGAAPQGPNQRYDALCAQVAHISVRRNQRDVVTDFSAEISGLGEDLSVVWDRFLGAIKGTEWHRRFVRRAAKWRQVP